MPLTQQEREVADAMEVTHHGEGSVEAEEAELVGEERVQRRGRSGAGARARAGTRARGRSRPRAGTRGATTATSPELGRRDGSIDLADADDHPNASSEQQQPTTTGVSTATSQRASRRRLRTSTSCDRQPLTSLQIRWTRTTGCGR
jgi:hypothetical protein